MRTPPKFWYEPKSWQAVLLSPIATVWASVTRRRVRKSGMRAKVPVICVGNVNIGGVGKTPSVVSILSVLQSAGWSPVVLTRGYGGKSKGAQLVSEGSAAAEVGDEAILLSSFAPVVVSPDRAAGATLAEQYCNIIVMDDGLQNPGLEKDISVLVVDSDIGFGNGLVFPAGPLREPVEEAKRRVDFALLIGGGKKRAEIASLLQALPMLEGHLKPLDMGINWQGRRVFAFAGIGRPEKFFNTLKALGAELVETRSFPDHAEIPERLLERMEHRAKQVGAQMVTTEKDAARLPAHWRGKVQILVVRLELSAGNFEEQLLSRLPKPPQR